MKTDLEISQVFGCRARGKNLIIKTNKDDIKLPWPIKERLPFLQIEDWNTWRSFQSIPVPECRPLVWTTDGDKLIATPHIPIGGFKSEDDSGPITFCNTPSGPIPTPCYHPGMTDFYDGGSSIGYYPISRIKDIEAIRNIQILYKARFGFINYLVIAIVAILIEAEKCMNKYGTDITLDMLYR